uniref:Uncharacterized protein n=1 Tax=Arundo donax TaxID=35708 RepID=A0A0A9BMG8_ARUDO
MVYVYVRTLIIEFQLRKKLRCPFKWLILHLYVVCYCVKLPHLQIVVTYV